MTFVSEHSFEEFVSSLGRLGGDVALPEAIRNHIDEVVSHLQASSGDVTPTDLAALIRKDPEYVPIIGLCVRLSHEQLKNLLQHRFRTQS